MDRPVAASPTASRVTLRPDRFARIFLVVCVAACVWLAIPPARDYISTQSRAEQTRLELQQLQAEQRRLEAQSREMSRGTGLEEQARRQGLIGPSERSYVIEDLPQP
ncbi:MAG: septum formation initiator family protein [Solirubrobacteraceae bacterium]|nr:septum formation initiator family protein [Solirubrobacteraceae bacterium]